jgi:hypothetical protein
MAQGIIRISPSALKGIIDLTVDPALIDLGKLKEALLLPERYTVEQVKPGPRYYYSSGHDVDVIVSSHDIPAMKNHSEMLPLVIPFYYSENSEDRKTVTISLVDIMINGVSAIKEEDKGRKMTVDIKETKEEKNARDTQFQGFAKLVMSELLVYFGDFDDMERIIARRAYDLVAHTLDHAPVTEYECKAKDIPDLAEWPKE